MAKQKIYAMYKGEELLGSGTLKQLAKKFNVRYKTMYFYTMPTYKRRCIGRDKRRELVELE